MDYDYYIIVSLDKADGLGQSSNCHSSLYLNLSHVTINAGNIQSYVKDDLKSALGVEIPQDSQVFFRGESKAKKSPDDKLVENSKNSQIG